MKKILIVITTSFVPYGGLTTVMMNYYRKLDMNKISIDFASTNQDIDSALLEELNRNNSQYHYLGDRKKNTLGYLLNLASVLKKNRYDAIHINSNSATASLELLVARLCSVKKRIVHNHTSRCDHELLHTILYPLFKTLYTDAISCSVKAGEWIFKDGKYILLNNGIDTKRFEYSLKKREKVRKQYHIKDDCILLGHVGKIYKPKNHAFLIELFSKINTRYPNTKLILVGDGELREKIEEQVHDLELDNQVIFAGMQRDIESYLSAMDLFVFPSIWEGMPLSVIEAQATGLDCYISKTIDDAVCITNTVCMLPIDNTECWLKQYEMLTKDDREVKSAENISLIQKKGFDTSLNVKQLEEIYLG